jgi:glutamin-(asparagin-)ase
VSEFIVPVLKEMRGKGIQIVRATRTGSGVVIRNGEQPDDKYDFVVVDDQNPQKARILTALALTKTNDSRELQNIMWKY